MGADLTSVLAPHHAAAVEAVVERFGMGDICEALLLVGSSAHGSGSPGSDVDVILVASEAEFARRRRERTLAFVVHGLATRPGGYVDVKVTSRTMLERIARRGSDPARYAFRDARILLTRDPSIGALLERVVRFPVEQRQTREHRFLAQVLAWTWFMEQAEAHDNLYLSTVATHKLVLFACRVVLNANEAVYPYHKWLLRETEQLPRQPEGFSELIAELLRRPSSAAAQRLKDAVLAFAGAQEQKLDWPNQFMVDSELSWLEHEAPIDDL